MHPDPYDTDIDVTRIKANKFERACRLFVLCVLVSLGGWVFETVGCFVAFGSSGDRGFLTLPLCPIYGISITAIYLLVGTPVRLTGPLGGRIRRTGLWRKTVQNKKWRKYAFYFIFVTLLSTAAELVTGLAMKPFGVKLWNYEDQPLNLFGVICPTYSLLWGVLITAFMSLAWKPLFDLIAKIPKRPLYSLSLTLAVPIAADFTVNAIKLFIG